MRKFIITIILVNLFFLSHGQNQYHEYYKLVRMAKKYELKNKLDSSLLLYKSAFSKVDYIPQDKLIAAIKISKKLKQKELYENLSDKLIAQKKAVNNEYAKEITEINKADQSVRTTKNLEVRDKYYACIKNGSCDQKELKKLKTILSKWWATDSIDINKLLTLIKNKGYPSEKLVGKDAAFSAHTILLHFDKDTDNVILKPILDKALLNGEILPRDYAFIIDRREINRGKPSYYYCVPFGIEKLSKDELEEVEKRRELIDYGKISETQIIVKKKKSYTVQLID